MEDFLLMDFYAHDFVWVDSEASLLGEIAPWVDGVWSKSLPLVVRRDVQAENPELLPVGIRGVKRSERCAVWVDPKHIIRRITPREVLSYLKGTPFRTMPVETLRILASRSWSFAWGPTGSCAYSLVTNTCFMRKESDLDIVIRSRERLTREALETWFSVTEECPARVDTQIDTGLGAFALREWMGTDTVLFKTVTGPRLVRDPWGGI